MAFICLLKIALCDGLAWPGSTVGNSGMGKSAWGAALTVLSRALPCAPTRWSACHPAPSFVPFPLPVPGMHPGYQSVLGEVPSLQGMPTLGRESRWDAAVGHQALGTDMERGEHPCLSLSPCAHTASHPTHESPELGEKVPAQALFLPSADH